MNKNLLPVLICLLMLGTPAFAQTQTDTKQHRVVFHVATNDTLVYRGLMRQLNTLTAFWPTASIEVVIHSFGIDLMRKDRSKVGSEIQALQAKGVAFAVCQNTMKAQKLTPEQLLPQAIFVPNGLAELVIKQEEGWSYIKAGH
jgi:intracellular sulfur oxidation DsrE/DsrF family protein